MKNNWIKYLKTEWLQSVNSLCMLYVNVENKVTF